MKRTRRRIVPTDGVEIFEIRIVLYFQANGRRTVQAIVSAPDDPDLEDIDLVELFGALEYGRQELTEMYAPTEGEVAE